MNAFILTGSRYQGKTTAAGRIIEELRAQGMRICGFLARGQWQNGHRSRFDLLDLQSGILRPLAERDIDSPIQQGAFGFHAAALRYGRTSLAATALKGCDLVVIDEIGALELAGNGWDTALQKLLSEATCSLLLIVSQRHLEPVIARYSLQAASVFSIDEWRACARMITGN